MLHTEKRFRNPVRCLNIHCQQNHPFAQLNRLCKCDRESINMPVHSGLGVALAQASVITEWQTGTTPTRCIQELSNSRIPGVWFIQSAKISNHLSLQHYFWSYIEAAGTSSCPCRVFDIKKQRPGEITLITVFLIKYLKLMFFITSIIGIVIPVYIKILAKHRRGEMLHWQQRNADGFITRFHWVVL